MRIALVAPDIPDYAAEFAHTVAEQADVLLFIPDKYQLLGYEFRSDRLEVRWLPWPRQRQFLRSVLFVVRLALQIRRWKPDVVHVLMDSYIWENLLYPLLGTMPVLTTIHDVCLHPGNHRMARVVRSLTYRVVARSDAILVHGDALRRQATSIWPISPERCFVLPHVPLWHYRRVADQMGYKKPNDGVFRVLFFGRISEYKGLQYLLKAIPLLQKSVHRLRIIIAGSGSDLASCRDLIESLPCVELFDRFVSVEDTARLFSEADMLVLPYTEASQSGVLMLAMTFGLAVVASDVGELGNTVKETGIGLLVPPRNEVALAEAMIEVACNTDLKSRLSQNAVAAAAGPFSRRSLSNRALSIYGTLLQSREPNVYLGAESGLLKAPATAKNGPNKE